MEDTTLHCITQHFTNRNGCLHYRLNDGCLKFRRRHASHYMLVHLENDNGCLHHRLGNGCLRVRRRHYSTFPYSKLSNRTGCLYWQLDYGCNTWHDSSFQCTKPTLGKAATRPVTDAQAFAQMMADVFGDGRDDKWNTDVGGCFRSRYSQWSRVQVFYYTWHIAYNDGFPTIAQIMTDAVGTPWTVTDAFTSHSEWKAMTTTRRWSLPWILESASWTSWMTWSSHLM